MENPTPQNVKTYIENALQCDLVRVEGDGRHFEAVIVSPLFRGKSMVQQHQLVYGALGDRMREEIHALSMRTFTPEDWAEKANFKMEIMDILEQIKQTHRETPIVLYMKGTPTFPQCGFSGRAVQVLRACGLTDKDYLAVNVLMDQAINEGIRQYVNWPTFPQLYLKDELIGGSDIMLELYEKGELQKLIAAARQ